MVTPESKKTERPTLEALLVGIVERALPAAQRRLVVSGVFDDSRQVRPGGLFVAIPGTTVDGRRFVGDALARGAAVVIGEDLEPVDDARLINVADARSALARLAVRWAGLDTRQSSGPRLLGITGTNGKTTTAFMTQAILQAGGVPCGMIGTVHHDLCGRKLAADLTTPGPLQLAEHLRQCADHGAQAVVIEVSSHALDQRRTDGLHFAAAAFTNLTQDHLDYHESFEAYRAAKTRLFTQLDDSAVAVVNVDDPHHRELLRGCGARVVTYALERAADITASITDDTIDGTAYGLRLRGVELALRNALVGRHNVYNALAAAGLALAAGMSTEAIERGLSAVRHIPGRLQRVPGLHGLEVFVDYAHTPDALLNVAGALRSLAPKRLIVVFGCGGDRDRDKRPLMAQAVAEFGDVIVVTSDNPRSEDPQIIIDDILAGFDENTHRRVSVEPDRRGAIELALADAREGDVVLIAGKGHEDYQVVGSERRHFDDVEVVIQAADAQAGKGGS
jgi:UDP-N-acetylmuramoyl-L-alanyl-D-glutamate--2,6-diaminopimelate ligase